MSCWLSSPLVSCSLRAQSCFPRSRGQRAAPSGMRWQRSLAELRRARGKIGRSYGAWLGKKSKQNLFFAVGVMNFGIQAPNYVERVKDRGELYADPASIWGRALHNGYFQVLSEGGIVGVTIYCLIALSFFRMNSATRRLC